MSAVSGELLKKSCQSEEGRQKKRWEDSIREWTGLEFAKSQRAVENRKNGEHWLQTHSSCPNDPRG